MQDGIGTFSAGDPLRGSELGSVISCRGSEAHVALMQRPTAHGPRATVGKFVALKHSKGASVGMISEISSAAASSDSYSDAIQTSAASSTIFFPIVWTPPSSSATVPDPSGRVSALWLSSANSSSKVFTNQG